MVEETSNEFFKVIEANKFREREKQEQMEINFTSHLKPQSQPRNWGKGGHGPKARRLPGLKGHTPPGPAQPVPLAVPGLGNTFAIKKEISRLVANKQEEHETSMQSLRASELKHEEFMFQWKSALQDELGVTVDAGFSQRRKQQKAMNLIFYQLYTSRIENSWNLWKEFVVWANARRIEYAGLVLTRLARGFLGRRRAQHMREVRELARQAVLEEERRKKIALELAMLRLSICCRYNLRKKVRVRKEREYSAASKIQALVRGCTTRVRLATQRLLNRSGITIQCFWRCVRAKTRLRYR